MMENMRATIISFNPKFNRHLMRLSQSDASPMFANKIKMNRLAISLMGDKGVLLSSVLDSCINRSLIHLECEKYSPSCHYPSVCCCYIKSGV